eukprot:8697079-Lingulodinium_polyedra.AAC.1
MLPVTEKDWMIKYGCFNFVVDEKHKEDENTIIDSMKHTAIGTVLPLSAGWQFPFAQLEDDETTYNYCDEKA